MDDGATPITTAGWVSSIDVGADDQHLLVTYSNYGVLSVWETTDGGANWYSKEGDLPDMPIRWGLFNPDNRNQVLLATELGVWTTDDFGSGTTSAPAWGPSNSDLAHTRVTMIKYRAADGIVVGSTHGRGLFTADFFVTSPVADFISDQNISCNGSLTVQFTDGSLKANNSWAWDVDNNGITNYTIQNPVHTYSSPGLYSVKLTIDNGSAQVVKEQQVLVANSEPTLNTGCTLSPNSNGNNPFGIGITQFTLSNIDHQTSNNDDYYLNNACTQWTLLEIGTSYDLTISTGVFNPEGAAVYIDYDDNGTFEAGEQAVSFPANKDGIRTLSFTTPSVGVIHDKGLRLRVLSKFGSIPTNACDIGPYGQAEDYTVYFANSAILPVSLVRFQGICDQGTVTVEWVTDSEQNNDFFHLERSMNGIDWEVINTIDGSGNSNAIHNYSVQDHHPNSGPNYYRLRQTDFDGTHKYSKVIAVSCDDFPSLDLNVYPNPSAGQFTISGFGNSADLTIINSMGQTILRTDIVSDEAEI